jgi:hypothetical protein
MLAKSWVLAGTEPVFIGAEFPRIPGRLGVLPDRCVTCVRPFTGIRLAHSVRRDFVKGQSMIQKKLKRTMSIAAVCCFLLILLPISSGAQTGIFEGAKHGIQKGAGAVGKGAEEAAGKTKEGAEAVGHGVKKAVTGEDNNQSDARTNDNQTQASTSSTGTRPGQTGQKRLPRTAGELPLLAFLGFLALVGAAGYEVSRRARQSRAPGR